MFSLYNVNDAAVVFNDALLFYTNRFVPLHSLFNNNYPLWFSKDLRDFIIPKKCAHIILKESINIHIWYFL